MQSDSESQTTKQPLLDASDSDLKKMEEENDLLLRGKSSNQSVLMVTAVSFALFVISEIIGALASNSLSLLGDAAAMSVDVFTYFANMYAERVKAKSKDGVIDPTTKFIIEVIVPFVSLSALIGVSIYITDEAIGIIKSNGEDDDGGGVNVAFLFGFAGANMVVDVISLWMFLKRGDNIFQDPNDISYIRRRSTSISRDKLARTASRDNTPALPGVYQHSVDIATGRGGLENGKKNLNMISAFTHVGCDTMRTLSVFVAAIIASTTNVTGTLCDAYAALVVSVTIFLGILPLIWELFKAFKENCSDSNDEEAEN